MARYIDADELLKKAIYPFIESDLKVVTVEDIKSVPTADVIIKENLKEEFEREIEIANKDIDFAEGTDENEENYMRGYLGGILCAYRIVFGKNYEESEDKNE